MALDQQRNWTVSMAENLDKVLRNSGKGTQITNSQVPERAAPAMSSDPVIWTTEPVYLPDEIIIHILEYVSYFRESQYTLASCCRLSLQWYSAAVRFLYERPYLYGKNFDPFVREICPSINLHVRQSPLAEHVKVLNMASLVHQGSRRLTARLLGRTKNNLEDFVAPQASFGVNCLAALSKCQHLRKLDLSLVSESPPLSELFKAVSQLESLTTFRLPRSSGFGTNFDPDNVRWPPRLENLCLSGGIDAHFMHGIVAFPPTLRSLAIEHCPLAKGIAVMHLLRTAARRLPGLETLKLANLPRLEKNSLDPVLYLLPRLRKLSVSVDYISPGLFDFNYARESDAIDQAFAPLWTTSLEDEVSLLDRPWRQEPAECQLQTLELTNSGDPGVEDKITPIDILIAIDEGVLPRLRQVRVAKSLLWHSNSTAMDAEALADALQDLKAKTHARSETGAEADDVETGVWTFDG